MDGEGMKPPHPGSFVRAEILEELNYPRGRGRGCAEPRRPTA